MKDEEVVDLGKDRTWNTVVILPDGEENPNSKECVVYLGDHGDESEAIFFRAVLYSDILELKAIQEAVGGYIEHVQLSEEFINAFGPAEMFVDEDGREKNLIYNNAATAVSILGLNIPLGGNAVLLRK